MKFIEKKLGNEPPSLKETRSTPGSSYDDCNKADIRIALLKEQGCICAYCMQRIKPDNTGIEHYEAQANDESKKMNYLNMVGVCRVSEGQPEELQHCDKSRGNQILTINPLDKNCENQIKYHLNGTIYSKDKDLQHDLNIILNLNSIRLINNRQKVIEIVSETLRNSYKNKKNKAYSKSDLNKQISIWQSRTNDKFRPFCQAAIFYLERKLARL